ncbi:MAG: hypothetical protein HY778_02585 [Betaproteobacteria bacterium]|nr:hypothetical protein [Betaproteobacteria bacterium]
METSKAWAAAVASVATFGALYVVCSVAVLLFPDGTIAFFNAWFHGIDLTPIRRSPAQPIGFGEWAWGLFNALVVSAAGGALFGWVYGRARRRR